MAKKICLILLLFLSITLHSTDTYANGSVELKTGPFLGKLVQSNALPRPVMVMIDNVKQARPQAGLEDASIVYEFLVEGGVTRFMALFYEKFPERVGPIRSTRAYFIQTALEYNALLLHVGASPRGYQLLNTSKIDHLDQIEDQSYFWRDNARNLPSNIYTIKAVPKFLRSNQPVLKPAPRFRFQNGLGAVAGTAYLGLQIKIHYWGGYDVGYQYDEEREHYLRLSDTEPHLMENGKSIYAKNIIIQYVETNVMDEEGRLDMQLIGSGNALFIKDGFVFTGTWSKQAGQKTIFLDASGNEWLLSPGQTWIEVVPTTCKVEYQ